MLVVAFSGIFLNDFAIWRGINRLYQTSLLQDGGGKVIAPHEEFCFDDELDLLFLYIWPGPYFRLMQVAVIDSFTEITSLRDVQDL